MNSTVDRDVVTGVRAEAVERSTPGVNLLGHLRFRNDGEPVHNAYLETLAELGPLGLLLFLGILISTASPPAHGAKGSRRR